MSVDEQVLIQRGDPELDKTKFERHKDWKLTNAPTEFQRLMQHVLRSLLNTKALIKKKFDLEVYETMSVDEQVLIQRGDPELDKTKFERHKDWKLTNAPTEFQRLMQHVLRSLLNTKALIKKKFDLEVYETMSVDEQVLIQRGDPELDKTKFERHKDWKLGIALK
ncbi:hypothetical protein CDAR_520841 [Caerostris darwini]|nr:hypothetical protein CDAR_520841 [Caerostris darwini]